MAEAGFLTHNLTKYYTVSANSDSLSYKFVVIRGGEGGTHAASRTCNGSVWWVPACEPEARLRAESASSTRHDMTRA